MNEFFAPRPLELDAGRFDTLPENSFTLPAEWYYEPEVYRAEHRAIFYRNWWYVGHRSDLPKAGDFFTAEIVDQRLFVIRGSDGVLRAFHNVCSHRAHPVVEGSGNRKLITCPYHQWCYGSDGKFRQARGRESLKSWIPDNADLKPIRLEDYGGLLFINFDADAVPLVEQAGVLLGHMHETCPRLEDLRRVHRFERDVKANWKTVIDNNHECYHCDANHRTLMELIDYAGTAVWTDDGITFSHRVQNKALENGAYNLRPEELAQESLFGFIFPVHIPLMFPGSPSLIMFQILPTGPETTRERMDFYLLGDQPSEQEQRFIDFITGTLVPEDVGLCEEVQKGLHSLGYRQGRFVVDRSHPEFSEHHVHFFQRMVRDALLGG